MSNLKNIRKSKKLTQAKLSEISGVNLRTLQDYEQGHKDINKAEAITVYKLSKALSCSVPELLEIENK
jgi:transcriptional regulator with XRE-family HTH domain